LDGWIRIRPAVGVKRTKNATMRPSLSYGAGAISESKFSSEHGHETVMATKETNYLNEWQLRK